MRVFVVTWSCSVTLLVSLSTPCRADQSSTFAVDQTYMVQRENNGSFGKIRVVREKGGTPGVWRYRVEVPIRFLGAVAFGLSDPALFVPKETPEQRALLKRLGEHHRKGARSFSHLPALRNRIESILREAERFINGPELEVRFSAEFIEDELKVIQAQEGCEDFRIPNRTPRSREEVSTLVKRAMFCLRESFANRRDEEVFSTQIYPFLEGNQMQPTLLTLGALGPEIPYLWTHELLHYLGMRTEGYIWMDYPCKGLMNDALTFLHMRERDPNATFAMIREDLNEMLRSFAASAFPKVDLEKAKAEFSPSSRERFKIPLARDQWSYLRISEEEASKLVREKCEKQTR